MIRLIVEKELRDHLRDSRSILASLALPLMAPLLLVAIFQLVSDLQRPGPIQLPVVGAEYAPSLIDYLEAHGIDVTSASGSALEEVQSSNVHCVLEISSEYGSALESSRPAEVELLFDRSRNASQSTIRTVERTLLEYSQRIGVLRLIARGVSPVVVQALSIQETDLATPEKLGANLLNIVPMLLMLAALAGGMNVAIDTTAGERERGSLEALLLNPVSRLELCLGKWLATAAASASVTVLTAGLLAVTLHWMPLEDLSIRAALDASGWILVMASMIPLVLVATSLQLFIATLSRTFKEAQTYLGLLNLVPMLPALLSMLETGESAWWMMLVPTLGQVHVISDLLGGEATTPLTLVLLWCSSLAYATAFLLGTTRLLHKESVIFGR